jgi:hypothetical protein
MMRVVACTVDCFDYGGLAGAVADGEERNCPSQDTQFICETQKSML